MFFPSTNAIRSWNQIIIPAFESAKYRPHTHQARFYGLSHASSVKIMYYYYQKAICPLQRYDMAPKPTYCCIELYKEYSVRSEGMK